MYKLFQSRKHHGRINVDATEGVVVSLYAYLKLHSGTEEAKVIVASGILKGETRQS